MSDNSLASVMNWIMWILFLLVFAYINRELEIMRIVREIEVYPSIYRRMKDKAINSVLTYFKEIAARQGDRIDLKRLEERVAGLVESVIINPESQDPYGLMTKLKHIVLTEDRTLTDEISRLIPNASRSDVERMIKQRKKLLNHLKAEISSRKRKIEASINELDSLAKSLIHSKGNRSG